jgi:hypothetical protein
MPIRASAFVLIVLWRSAMFEIKGQFEVVLTKAIDLVPDISQSDLPVCEFVMNESQIFIWPLKITEAVVYPEGDYDSPKLTEIKIYIIRQLELQNEQQESMKLPREQELVFENILIEAIRRFVTIIRLTTNQWDLDTRHPVYAYSFKYWHNDTPIETSWPLEAGAKRMPQYSFGTFVVTTLDAQSELSPRIWQNISKEISSQPIIEYYEELLADAKAFRYQMRYYLSVFYFAIASELMLEKACNYILLTKHHLGEKGRVRILRDMNIPDLTKLLNDIVPNCKIKYENIRKLFELRNKIAHGNPQQITGENAHLSKLGFEY